MDSIKATKYKVVAYAATVSALKFSVGAAMTWLVIDFGYTGWHALAMIGVLALGYGVSSAMLTTHDA